MLETIIQVSKFVDTLREVDVISEMYGNNLGYFSSKPFLPIGTLFGFHKIDYNSGSWKIFEQPSSPPLMRIDSAHHGLPDLHLQMGHNDYFGRHGNEAVDIFVSVITGNPFIFNK